MSSPRQKMVAVAPLQQNELEQKKKRQTLERAKANHLSKQLQMRLQYAKLKVEHGWQRQNLNEVENLYFHHSHLRNMRGQRLQYATVSYSSAPAPLCALEPNGLLSPTPTGAPDQTVGPACDASPTGSLSPPSQSPSEHAPIAPSSQPQPHLFVQAPVPVAPSPASTATNRPPSGLDLSDPSMLARLAQTQAQVQVPSSSSSAQSESQTLSRQPLTTAVPASTCTPTSAAHPAPGSVPVPGAFSSHIQVSQASLSHSHPSFSPYIPQMVLGTPTTGPLALPLYPAPTAHPIPTTHSTTAPPVSASALTVPAPVTHAPSTTSASTPSATALTYDSFWSTHASSTGPTRALYRTHAGFSASAAPGGNVAMLTPGGHAAVMTAEGVYVGGASSRSD